MIEDDPLLKNIILFGIKLALISKKNDRKPVCNKKKLKTKIWFHGDGVTKFYDKKEG